MESHYSSVTHNCISNDYAKYHKKRSFLKRIGYYFERRNAGQVVQIFGLVVLTMATMMALVNYTTTTIRRHKQEEVRYRKRLAAAAVRDHRKEMMIKRKNSPTILDMLSQVEQDIRNNIHGGIRWVKTSALPPLPGKDYGGMQYEMEGTDDDGFFAVKHQNQPSMAWELEWNILKSSGKSLKPIVDYTDPAKYKYPTALLEPPRAGGYPEVKTLQEMLANWDQDADFEGTITETLIHFNYSNPGEREAARKFRDAKLPFKLVDVPEVAAANLKWTDEYVGKHFDEEKNGRAQESPNNYFAFFQSKFWDVDKLGLAPTRDNDFTFKEWSEHARYADASQLSFESPHFYWQAGVDREERYRDYSEWSFISKDLPSFSSPDPEGTFFVFSPEEQKGIQCRFGERGVVAATHYDGGRNMIAMVTGAKRYILSPPRECSKLGLWSKRGHPSFRHSMLNFAHIKYLNNDQVTGMSEEERTWLERAGGSYAVETVLKAGEVLYLPSFWFHYIVSLQKSAQCNVRSGSDEFGTKEFGSFEDVDECTD